MYANHLFIKRRTKEFALFQLIGLTRGNILRMLSIEQFAIFVVTGILGVIIGILVHNSCLPSLQIMKLKVHLSIGFEPQALLVNRDVSHRFCINTYSEFPFPQEEAS